MILPQDDGSRKGARVSIRRLETQAFPPHIVRPMSKRFVTFAWIAAGSVYVLIVLGFVVRITGSGLGCGNHWPLCSGRLFPPLSDPGAVIEWSHRLVAGIVSILIIALAVLDWRRSAALVGLLVLQVALGA